jgi:hypothetical protein
MRKPLSDKNLAIFLDYLCRKLAKLETSFETVKIEQGKLQGLYALSVNGINVCYGTPKELEFFVEGATMLRSYKFV